MATHSSILAWRIPWTEELGGLQSTGCKESDTAEQLHFHFHLIGFIEYILKLGIYFRYFIINQLENVKNGNIFPYNSNSD